MTEGKVESGLLEAVADELQRHPGITFIPIQRAMIERGRDEPLRVEPRLLPNGLAELIFTRLEVTPTADVRELVEAGYAVLRDVRVAVLGEVDLPTQRRLERALAALSKREAANREAQGRGS